MRKVELRTHFSTDQGEKASAGVENWTDWVEWESNKVGSQNKGVDETMTRGWIVFSFSTSAERFTNPPTTVDEWQSELTPMTVVSSCERDPFCEELLCLPGAAQQSIVWTGCIVHCWMTAVNPEFAATKRMTKTLAARAIFLEERIIGLSYNPQQPCQWTSSCFQSRFNAFGLENKRLFRKNEKL